MAKRIEHTTNIVIEPSPPIIARLNDELRCSGRGGRIVLTSGVQAISKGTPAALARAACMKRRRSKDRWPGMEEIRGFMSLPGFGHFFGHE